MCHGTMAHRPVRAWYNRPQAVKYSTFNPRLERFELSFVAEPAVGSGFVYVAMLLAGRISRTT